jgi:hypothetical protein
VRSRAHALSSSKKSSKKIKEIGPPPPRHSLVNPYVWNEHPIYLCVKSPYPIKSPNLLIDVQFLPSFVAFKEVAANQINAQAFQIAIHLCAKMKPSAILGIHIRALYLKREVGVL